MKDSEVNCSKPFMNFLSNRSLICSHVSDVRKYVFTNELDQIYNYVRDDTITWAGISRNQVPLVSVIFLHFIQQRVLPLTEFNLAV